jgi:hypothetical protein
MLSGILQALDHSWGAIGKSYYTTAAAAKNQSNNV